MAALQLAAGAKGKRLRAGEGINLDQLRHDPRARAALEVKGYLVLTVLSGRRSST